LLKSAKERKLKGHLNVSALKLEVLSSIRLQTKMIEWYLISKGYKKYYENKKVPSMKN